MNNRLVIDTNTLISAALIQGSPSAQGVALLLQSGHDFVFSSETFDELEGVLQRPKFDRYIGREKKEEFLALHASFGVFVMPKKHFTHCRDPKDNKFLDTAVEGQAAALISGDSDLLQLREIEGIPIVTLTEFLQRLRQTRFQEGYLQV